MTAASSATATRGAEGRAEIENAAGEQVNELRRVMRASESVK